MKKYLAVIKSTLQEYFTYRLGFFLEISGGFILILATVALWYAVFKTSGSEKIGDYTLSEMITYLLGAGIIFSSFWLSGQGDEINDDINYGWISQLLTKPMSVPTYWFMRDISARLLTFLLSIGTTAIILLLFRNFLVVPVSVAAIFLALTMALFGYLLHYFLFYIFSIIAFWMDQTWGPRFVIRVITEIAAGIIIPLSFFPGIWKIILDILPFKYLVYVPMEIYLGKISGTAIFWEVLGAFLWLLILVLIARWEWRRGLKHYSAVGG